MKKMLSKNKGITLVALVITIIVLLILAGVSMSMVLDPSNGLIAKAKQAKIETDKAQENEVNGINSLASEIDKYTGSGTGETEIPKETDKSKSYVGYYADIDKNGTVDGIIYADLITGAVGDGQWTDSYGNYTIPTITTTEAKNYYVSQESYEGKFGTKPVLSPISGTTGTDRFYVMALEDFNKGTYYNWYYSALGNMSDYATYTSQDFGTGKANTNVMITKWKNAGYGTTDAGGTYKDVWGQIQTEVAKGWYIPSKAEWAAFGGEIAEKLGITTSNYANFGLSGWYWSSSQGNTDRAWLAYFRTGSMGTNRVSGNGYVRLAVTF